MTPEKLNQVLTADRLRNVLIYDGETGRFLWAISFRGVNRGSMAGGSSKAKGYMRIQVDGQQYAAHRLAWLYVYGCWPSFEIDHINGVRHDNRISNLRDVSRAVNSQNIQKARSDNKSAGLIGASWNKRAKKFSAQIVVGGRKRHLGLFQTAEIANQAYVNAKRIYHPGNQL
jgi:phage gp46-like protein